MIYYFIFFIPSFSLFSFSVIYDSLALMVGWSWPSDFARSIPNLFQYFTSICHSIPSPPSTIYIYYQFQKNVQIIVNELHNIDISRFRVDRARSGKTNFTDVDDKRCIYSLRAQLSLALSLKVTIKP